MAIRIKARFRRSEDFEIDVNLNLPASQIVALFGKSGSGKSSILRFIAGLERHPENFLSINGQILQDGTRFVKPEEREIGYVFQNLNLFPHISAMENLKFGLARSKSPSEVKLDEIIDILEIKNLLGKFPSELSGGEQQRVAIGRALLSTPRLLLLDEPLSWLDQDLKFRLLNYFKHINRSLQIPIILVSHSFEEVINISDWIYELKDGKAGDKKSVREFSLGHSETQGADQTAVVTCKFIETDIAHSLTNLDFEGDTIYITSPDIKAHDTIRIRIDAKDVSISKNWETETSILNRFPVTIESIIDPGSGPSAILQLNKNKQFFFSKITRKSLYDLSLTEGQVVLAQVKSAALLH